MPWASVCSKWFVCLFSDVLPVETCLRLWDCLFYEGSKILLRAAITLILMNADNILKTKEFGEMVETFQKCTLNSDTMQCHDFINVSKQICFEIVLMYKLELLLLSDNIPKVQSITLKDDHKTTQSV